MSLTKSVTALIFDMDGVVVDNHKYHLQAWIEFCARHGIVLTEEEFTTKMFGGNNKALLERVFGREMQADEALKFAQEKEELYRKIHLPYIEPLPGLHNFLDDVRQSHVPIAIATAAPRENLEFVLRNTGISKYFDVMLDESNVINGKPDPEIYLKAARLLEYPPERCIVFEDSLTGIRAAQTAGMRVVGVTTSLDLSQLKHTWKQIPDFTGLSIKDLINEATI